MKQTTKIALAVAAGAAALLLKKKHSVDGIGAANYFPDIKRRQLDIILSSNPADENLSYHTWIRDVDDILLYEEACADESCLSFAPDYTEKDAMKALRNKKLRVYSSYPIENGVFVTPSYMEAKSYAGSGNVYDKVVLLDDVAWIDTLQGQYAPVSGIGAVTMTRESLIKLFNLYKKYDETREVERLYDLACDVVYAELEEQGVDVYADENEKIVIDALRRAGLADEKGETDVYVNRLNARKELLNYIHAKVLPLLPLKREEIEAFKNDYNVVRQNKLIDIIRNFLKI